MLSRVLSTAALFAIVTAAPVLPSLRHGQALSHSLTVAMAPEYAAALQGEARDSFAETYADALEEATGLRAHVITVRRHAGQAADQDDERRALQAGAKMEDVTINYQVSCGLDGCVQENYKLSNMARNAKQIQGILGAMDQHARNIGLGSNNVSRGLA